VTLRPVFDIDGNAADKANREWFFIDQYRSEIGSEVPDHAVMMPNQRDPFGRFRAVVIAITVGKGRFKQRLN